jgi:hypothetical protein
MKSNAQLRHKAQGYVPQPPPVTPTEVAPSSQAVTPSLTLKLRLLSLCLLWELSSGKLILLEACRVVSD